MKHNFLHFRTVFGITLGWQIFVISLLFTLLTVAGYQQYQDTGLMFGYPLSVSILFVPIYEELIFRGILLTELLNHYSEKKSILISSLLFALWHIKNIFWLSPTALLVQIAFAGLVFGPLAAYVTIKMKTVWPAVILHYLNNLLAGVQIVTIVIHLFR